MVDRNLQDFYGRLYRIQKIRRRGGGFEAPGTLGKSYFVPRASRNIPIVGPLLIVLVAVTCLKAVILAEVGTKNYDSRIAALEEGGIIDRIGGLVMIADPATEYLSGKIQTLRTK